MMNVFMYSITLLLMVLIMMMLMYMISYKSMMDHESSSFECGFDLFESSRIPFSSHFFMIAVIFLIFDIELVIIMPMIIIIPMLDMIYCNIFLFCLCIVCVLFR